MSVFMITLGKEYLTATELIYINIAKATQEKNLRNIKIKIFISKILFVLLISLISSASANTQLFTDENVSIEKYSFSVDADLDDLPDYDIAQNASIDLTLQVYALVSHPQLQSICSPSQNTHAIRAPPTI